MIAYGKICRAMSLQLDQLRLRSIIQFLVVNATIGFSCFLEEEHFEMLVPQHIHLFYSSTLHTYPAVNPSNTARTALARAAARVASGNCEGDSSV